MLRCGAGAETVCDGTHTIVIDVGSRQLHASNRDLMGVMDDMNLGAGPADDEDPDDLLGMMDAAGRD